MRGHNSLSINRVDLLGVVVNESNFKKLPENTSIELDSGQYQRKERG
jgi:hypothetical protein